MAVAGQSASPATAILGPPPRTPGDQLSIARRVGADRAGPIAGSSRAPPTIHGAAISPPRSTPSASRCRRSCCCSRRPASGRRSPSPQNPRAFYFNDRVIVTHVPGASFMEVAVHDPRGGARFYTLPQDPAGKPVLTASGECLRCHVSSNTMEVPGFIARSMYTGRDGRTHPGAGQLPRRSPAATTPSAGGAGSSPARRTPCGTWATPSSATRRSLRQPPRRTSRRSRGVRRPSATCRRTVTSRLWRSSTIRCTR